MSSLSTETTYNTDLLYGGGKRHEYGTYSFLKVLPESNASSITITAGGGSDLIFSLPTRTCMNLSKSILYFISTPVAAGSSTFNWQWVNTVPFFQRCSVFTTTGRFLMDCDSMANRLAVELPLRTPLNKLLNNDKPNILTNATTSNAGTPGGLWQGLHTINTTIGNTSVTASTSNFFGKHADAGVNMFTNYTEKREIMAEGDTAGNIAQPVVTWQFPLAIFGDILADPRILAFNEQLFLKFQMSPVAKCYFKSASATDPTSSAAAGTSITLSSINLQLAVCQDLEIARNILSAVASPTGLELLFDYTNALKLATTGSTQSFSNTITRAFGPRLKSVLFSFWNTQNETANNAYLRNNISQAIYTQIQTWMNSVPLQIQPLTISTFDDYQHLQNLLANTCYQSSSEFYHDSFFMDYFYDIKKALNVGQMGPEDPRCLQGIEILSDIVYQMQATTVSASNTIYVFQKFQRRLNINSQGTFIDGNP